MINFYYLPNIYSGKKCNIVGIKITFHKLEILNIYERERERVTPYLKKS